MAVASEVDDDSLFLKPRPLYLINQQTFDFDITEQGDYVVALYTADEEWADCILGQLYLSSAGYTTTGIRANDDAEDPAETLYDLQGRRTTTPGHGVYIKHVPGKGSRKVLK